MFKLGVILVALSGMGCAAYSIQRYSPSTDNVLSWRELRPQKIAVGDFSATGKDTTSLSCQGWAPIGTPDGETYSNYVRQALVNELKLAEVYAESAPVVLSGKFLALDFSSLGENSSWHMVLEVKSSNGRSTTLEETRKFPSSLSANATCSQSSLAFVPAVQDLLSKLIHSPDFKKLVASKP